MDRFFTLIVVPPLGQFSLVMASTAFDVDMALFVGSSLFPLWANNTATT